MTTEQVPISATLFTWQATEPRLIGSECVACQNVTFPQETSCPRCGSEEMRERLLRGPGVLWSWTVQNVSPPSPPFLGSQAATFEPYGVGYVELEGTVRVEGRLTECDPARLSIGMPMELRIVPFAADSEGRSLLTFAFAPAVVSAP